MKKNIIITLIALTGVAVAQPATDITPGATQMLNDASNADAATSRTNLAVPGLATANTFTGANIFSDDFTVDTNSLFVDASLDRVGIGTITPGTLLDVNGAATFGGDIVNTGRSILLSQGSAEAFLGSIDVGGFVDRAGLWLANDDGTVTTLSQNATLLKFTGGLDINVEAGEDIYFKQGGGSAILTVDESGLDIGTGDSLSFSDGGSWDGAIISGAQSFSSTVGITDTLTVTGQKLIVSNATAPSMTLNSSSDSQTLRGGMGLATGASQHALGSGVNDLVLYGKSAGDIVFATAPTATTQTVRGGFSEDGDFYVDTDTLFVDASTDRVGIGTTTPGQPLEIRTTASEIVQVIDTSRSASLTINSATNTIDIKGGNGDAVWISTAETSGNGIKVLNTGEAAFQNGISFNGNSGTWDGAIIAGAQSFSSTVDVTGDLTTTGAIDQDYTVSSQTSGSYTAASNLLAFTPGATSSNYLVGIQGRVNFTSTAAATHSSTAVWSIKGISGFMQFSGDGTFTNGQAAIAASGNLYGTGTVSQYAGFVSEGMQDQSSGTRTITNEYGAYTRTGTADGTNYSGFRTRAYTHGFTNYYGYAVEASSSMSGTSSYGVHVGSLTGTGTIWGLYVDTNDSYLGGTAEVVDDLTVDTDTFFVDASADAVGIGTLTPEDTFHVDLGAQGETKFGSNETYGYIVGHYPTTAGGGRAIAIKRRDTTAVDALAISANASNGITFDGTNTHYDFNVSGTSQVLIANTGDLTLNDPTIAGDLTMSGSLDFTGQVDLESASTYFGDSGGYFLRVGDGTYRSFYSNGTATHTGNDSWYFGYNATYNKFLLQTYFNGLSPGIALQTRGTADNGLYITGDAGAKVGINAEDPDASLHVYSSASEIMRLERGGVNEFTFSMAANGDLGIRDTSQAVDRIHIEQGAGSVHIGGSNADSNPLVSIGFGSTITLDDPTIAGDLEMSGQLEATGQAITGDSSLVTSGLLEQVFTRSRTLLFPTSGWHTTFTGSSGMNESPGSFRIYTGTTTGSDSLARLNDANGSILFGNPGAVFNTISWDERFIISLHFATLNPNADTVLRFQVGDAITKTTVSDLAADGVGFKVENATLKALTHDGVSLTTSASIGTISTTTRNHIVIDSDGAGNVAYYLNGSLVHTATSGPTSDGAANESGIHFSATNGAGTSNFFGYLSGGVTLITGE